MYTAGNLGRGRRGQPTPEVDLLAVARVRRAVLPSSVRKRRLSRAGNQENSAGRQRNGPLGSVRAGSARCAALYGDLRNVAAFSGAAGGVLGSGPPPPESTCGSCGNRADSVTLSGWGARGHPHALNFWTPSPKFLVPPHIRRNAGGSDVNATSGHVYDMMDYINVRQKADE